VRSRLTVGSRVRIRRACNYPAVEFADMNGLILITYSSLIWLVLHYVCSYEGYSSRCTHELRS
jgi:hypothetical protein